MMKKRDLTTLNCQPAPGAAVIVVASASEISGGCRGANRKSLFRRCASVLKPKTLLAGVFLVFYGAVAQAACDTISCSGVGAQAVVSVYPNQTGNIYLEAPAADRSALNCALEEGMYMVLKSDHPQFKVVYASILYGLSSGKTMKVRIFEGSPNCSVAYVRVWTP